MDKSLIKLNSIQNNNLGLQIFSSLAVVVIICILISKYAFKDGKLTCDSYVFNTYLYIILAIILMFLVVLMNDKFGIFNSLLEWMFSGSIIKGIIVMILIIVVIIFLTYILHKTPPENLVASNGIWLLLVFLLGVLLIPNLYLARAFNVATLAALITIIIVIVVGLTGYYYGDKIITFDWDYYLRIALIILIVVSILGMLFITNLENMITFIYIISIISLIIFVLLLFSNHKKLKENAEKCIDGKMVPNYPVQSWGIVIKIYIIFKDIINILITRKLRK
jgi:FtsH-binding integral membrane protein